jgi:hypothetical protein
MSWNEYIEWSKLNHLTELVSLDDMLNPSIIESSHDDENDWNSIHLFENLETGYYTNLDYVKKKITTNEKYNLLTISIEPEEDCQKIIVDDFEFIGYDLLDFDFYISALTNCGGFDETFSPSDLNDKGLIDNFQKAYDIKKRLLDNNPVEFHADTNVIAIWRHKTLGR